MLSLPALLPGAPPPPPPPEALRPRGGLPPSPSSPEKEPGGEWLAVERGRLREPSSCVLAGAGGEPWCAEALRWCMCGRCGAASGGSAWCISGGGGARPCSGE